ncbi:expressed unknown protein [Ectocarpus siliculosus]|uniref:Uncharacterized protein n=1 Tax=Ectocarpus siliculosus TaxID=2880 RepID=D7G745_ECTSI|nr:expressed unknown protein [Ectocarpus siliculosus]|eukprot:CBJ25738.1 expressed unknown protein [Ectocarpus siliculosus]
MMCYWFPLDGAQRGSSHASHCISLSAHCIPPPASLFTSQKDSSSLHIGSKRTQQVREAWRETWHQSLHALHNTQKHPSVL